MAGTSPIASRILGEAADWLVRLREGGLSPQEQQHFLQWQQRSQQHAAAWQRAQHILNDFDHVPAPLAKRLIPELAASAANTRQRRRLLAGLGLAALTAPTAWLATRHQLPGNLMLSADYRSGIGDIRNVRLPDGSLLVLNTASAVDLRFQHGERRIHLLAGEILVETSHDPAYADQPFLVQTAQGTATALGTRYSVRQFDNDTAVAVFNGRVAVRHNDGSQDATILQPGQSLRFGPDAQDIMGTVDDSALMWRQGMLVARDMQLSDLLKELGRYRPGWLGSTPTAGQLRVSGAFPLRDTDASLALLQDTLPVHIRQRTRYWVTVAHQSD